MAGASCCTLITIGKPSRGLMFLARFAYLSVLSVSSNWSCAGETLVIIVVRQLPPRLSLSSRVSFESRYGTCDAFLVLSASALMQLPSARSERLMFAPSVSRCPLLSVFVARSEPARSIIESLPSLAAPSPNRGFEWTDTCNTACERDETSLHEVASVVRYRLPSCIICIISLGDCTSFSLAPAT